MDEIDRKALYWCLKLSRMAVYNQLYTETDPVEPRLDPTTKQLQTECLDKARTVMMALGRELDVDD